MTDSKPMANAHFAMPLSMARTDGRTNERVSHLPEKSPVPYRARENRSSITHADREFTEFIDRVQDRQKRLRSQRRLASERWVDPPRMTRQKNYDQQTERLRTLGANARKAA